MEAFEQLSRLVGMNRRTPQAVDGTHLKEGNME